MVEAILKTDYVTRVVKKAQAAQRKGLDVAEMPIADLVADAGVVPGKNGDLPEDFWPFVVRQQAAELLRREEQANAVKNLLAAIKALPSSANFEITLYADKQINIRLKEGV